MKIRIVILSAMMFLSIPGLEARDAVGHQDDKPMVYMVANAHLDTQWRWDIRQTIGEFLPNTFLQNIDLIEKFPGYIFNFEGAVKYNWAKEYWPDIYEKLKKCIADGTWHPSGSSWDANDPNLPSTEASIRNILYGQHFYRDEFGVECTDIMLPDCFGFGYALPTIAAHCGLTAFGTQKLQWRARPFYPDGRRFPFLFGIWKGIDGSRIMASLDGGNYSWDPTNEDLSDFQDFKDRLAKNPIPAAYRYFGTRSSRLHDDQGGSPTPNAVRLVDNAIKNPKDYNLCFATIDQMFKDYYMDERLPEFDGELLMDIHATGCYTSHSELKKINRSNEWLLVSSEEAGVIADWLGAMPYPSWTIDEAWKKVILHQFHDDLTGTSLPAAYQFTYNDEYVVENQLRNTIRAEVLASAAGLDTRVKGVPVVVYNPVSAKSKDVVTVEIPLADEFGGVDVYGPSGRKLNAQLVSREAGKAVVAFASESAPLSISVYDARPVRKAQTSSTFKSGKRSIENRVYRVTVDDNGDICSIVDKRSSRELVKSGESFGLVVFENNESNVWPAWEILKPVLDRTPSKISGDVRISVEKPGPLSIALRVEKTYGPSSFVQRIILTDGAFDDRIDIENELDWQNRSSLLKYSMPMNLSSEEATYDLGLGSIRRGTSTDLKYEVYAHQWADLTAEDASYGVTVMNNSKYGWDHPDANTLRLTLLHTPTAVAYDKWQQTMDLGKHSFTFSICGHAGSLSAIDADVKSDCLNQPALAYVAEKHSGSLGKSFSILSSSPSIRVKALKKACDGNGIVVRTYELSGKANSGEIVFSSEILSAEELTGIEDRKGPASFSGRKLFVESSAFEPKTYRVVLKENGVSVPSAEFVTMDIPFNAIAITSDAFSAFGHMDDEWHSYPAEMIPSGFSFAGVPFSIGEADFNNAVRCHGQKIAVPAGADKVYLLAASSDGEREAVFNAGADVRLTVGDFTGWYGYYGWQGYYDGVRRSGDVAYMGTHRHDSRKRNEVYEYTYMYILEIPVEGTDAVLSLPDDPKVVVFAATAEI